MDAPVSQPACCEGSLTSETKPCNATTRAAREEGELSLVANSNCPSTFTVFTPRNTLVLGLEELLSQTGGIPGDQMQVPSYSVFRSRAEPLLEHRRQWAAEMLALAPETSRGTHLYGNGSYIVVETDDPKAISDWLLQWTDLASFEVQAVLTDEELGELFQKHGLG